MKRRNRMGHQNSASRGRNALNPLAKRAERKRKSWTFEQLEARLVFSASPVSVGYSTNDAAGAALAAVDELRWAALAAGNTNAAGTATYAFMSLPNDPLFGNEWHILNTGQEVGNPDLQHLFGVAGEDLNVVPAWNMVDSNGQPDHRNRCQGCSDRYRSATFLSRPRGKYQRDVAV